MVEIDCRKLQAKQNCRMSSEPKKKKKDSGRSSATVSTLTAGDFQLKYWYFTQGVYPKILKYLKQQKLTFVLSCHYISKEAQLLVLFPSLLMNILLCCSTGQTSCLVPRSLALRKESIMNFQVPNITSPSSGTENYMHSSNIFLKS